MFKLQKKAARVITGDPYDIRSNEVLVTYEHIFTNSRTYSYF